MPPKRGKGAPARGASAGQLAVKRARLSEEFQTLARAEERESWDSDLAAIVTHLLAHPEKTRAVRLAVEGAMFEKSNNQVSKFFPATYVYLHKVPKEHLVNACLPKVSTKLTAATLKSLLAADRRAHEKLFYFSTVLEPRHKLFHHEKDAFDTMVVQRAQHVGQLIDELTWDEQGAIDWHTSGLFRLLPAAPEDEGERESHKFTHVQLICLPRPLAEAKLPAEYNVTTKWVVNNNWLLSASLCSPADVRPKTTLCLADMYEHLEEYQAIAKPLQVTAGARPEGGRSGTEAPPAEQASPQDSASEAGSGPSGSSSSAPPPAMLSKSEISAALAKLRRKSTPTGGQ